MEWTAAGLPVALDRGFCAVAGAKPRPHSMDNRILRTTTSEIFEISKPETKDSAMFSENRYLVGSGYVKSGWWKGCVGVCFQHNYSQKTKHILSKFSPRFYGRRVFETNGGITSGDASPTDQEFSWAISNPNGRSKFSTTSLTMRLICPKAQYLFITAKIY